MADVARVPVRSPVDLPIRDEPGTDRRPDLEEQQFAPSRAATRPELAERHQVGIVVDPDGDVVPGAEALGDRILGPVRREVDHGPRARLAIGEMHGADHGQADPPQPLPHRVFREDPVEQRLEPVERVLRALVHARALVVFDQEPPREVRQPSAQRGVADRRHEDVPGVVSEPDLPRGASTGRRPEFAVGGEAHLDERRDPIGDHGATESRHGLDLLPGRRRARPHQLHDGDQGVQLAAAEAYATAVASPVAGV